MFTFSKHTAGGCFGNGFLLSKYLLFNSTCLVQWCTVWVCSLWAFSYLFIFVRSRHKLLIRVVHRGYSTEDACLIGPLFGHSLAFHLSFRSPLLKTALGFLAEFGSSSSRWCLVHQLRAFHPLARVCGWFGTVLKWWTYSDWDLIKKLPMSMRPCSSCAMQMQDEACFALESLTGWEMLCRSPGGCFALHQILRDPSKSKDWALWAMQPDAAWCTNDMQASRIFSKGAYQWPFDLYMFLKSN